MLSGARIEVDERKEDPLDFALWKAAKPGEPTWPSPWGAGRPGWHIECSAMCSHHLGGAGRHPRRRHRPDLPAPRKRDRPVRGFLGVEPFARYWLHNGMLQLGGDKMSKSIGNVIRIRDLIEGDWRGISLDGPAIALSRAADLHGGVAGAAERGLERLIGGPAGGSFCAAPQKRDRWSMLAAQHASDEFRAAMDDDFNSPAAVAALFDLARAINRARDAGAQCRRKSKIGRSMLIDLAAVLGLDLETESGFCGDAAPFIDLLVEVRDQLRAEKQWALSDLDPRPVGRERNRDCGRIVGIDLAEELNPDIARIGNGPEPAVTNGCMAAMPSMSH